jgi:hypothetical protein
MKKCLLCNGQTDKEVCHTCHRFLKDRYGKDYEEYLEFLEEKLGGEKSVEQNLEKEKRKRSGGKKR